MTSSSTATPCCLVNCARVVRSPSSSDESEEGDEEEDAEEDAFVMSVIGFGMSG